MNADLKLTIDALLCCKHRRSLAANLAINAEFPLYHEIWQAHFQRLESDIVLNLRDNIELQLRSDGACDAFT